MGYLRKIGFGGWVALVGLYVAMAAIVAMAAGAIRADVVTLKNGEVFKGRMLLQTEQEIQLETSPGAVLTFPRAQIESIEAEKTAASAPVETSRESSAPSPAKDFKELQAQVAALQEEVKKLKEDVATLRKGAEEIAARTQQVAAPRGDLPGEEPSKLSLANMRWSRAGDSIKVEGVIKNAGGSPGRWVRVLAVVKDLMGTVIGEGDTTPQVSTPGVAVRDVGWVLPGKDVPISVFVPFGAWSKASVFTPEGKEVKAPRRLPRTNEITVEWKLEVPPKYAEAPTTEGKEGKGKGPATAGQTPAGPTTR